MNIEAHLAFVPHHIDSPKKVGKALAGQFAAIVLFATVTTAVDTATNTMQSHSSSSSTSPFIPQETPTAVRTQEEKKLYTKGIKFAIKSTFSRKHQGLGELP